MASKVWNAGQLVKPVPCPPAPVLPYIKQLVPKAGRVTKVVFVHPSVIGYLTHYIDRRTGPCLNSATFCEPCRSGVRQRWEGYAGVRCLGDGKIYILKVTGGAYRNCVELVSMAGQLRGLEFACTRMGNANNSPLRMRAVKHHIDTTLPAPFPLEKALARYWGYPEIAHIENVAGSELPAFQEIAEEDHVD